MSSPRAIILNTAGINCNEETGFAFEKFGAEVEQVHISQLHSGDHSLADYQILAIPGGFSDGDAIQAGRTVGIEVSTQLGDDINEFVARGGLGIFICNGFQIATEIGLLPDGQINPEEPKKLSLVRNANGKFVDDWQRMSVDPSTCLFAQPNDIGEQIELPVANGEGRLVAKDTTAMAHDLATRGLIVFRYTDKNNVVTEAFPDNPSGTLFGITGVTDPSGQLLGMMPHPERFVDTKQHPNWRRGLGHTPFGGLIIKQMVKVAKAA